MVVVGVVPHKPCHFPRVRVLRTQLPLGLQLSGYVDVIELLEGRDKTAVSDVCIASDTWGHRELTSSISRDDCGGAVAGVGRAPLSVSLSIAPLLAWIKRFKIIGKQ